MHWIFLRSCAPLVFATPPDFQANAWEALSPGGSIPSVRRQHTAVWSNVADGFYVFGGYDGSRCRLSGATLGNCCESGGTVETEQLRLLE